MDDTLLEHHVSGLYTKILMEILAESLAPGDIRVLLERAGETRPVDELSDVTSWSSYRQFRRLLEERARLDPTSLYQHAQRHPPWIQHGELAQVIQTLESPGKVLAAGSALNPLVPIRRYEKTEVAPNEWTIREGFIDGYPPYPEYCDFAALQYAMIPALFHLAPGEVVEEECQCRGDATCLFRFRWEECASSEVESLRAQNQLLEIRLEQIQGMVTDLASNEEYEAVLQGLVSSSLRAAVGASGALLALDKRGGIGRKVYFEGFTESEAGSMADGLLAERPGSNQVLATEVVSARRRYGVLAIDESGGVFTASAKATLETYARLAAAALDTADALEDARHQARTAHVLLELSASLAEIVSTEEMVAKVARAVPDIVDCDQAAVFLDQAAGPKVDSYPATGNSSAGTTGSAGTRLVAAVGFSDEAVDAIRSRRFDAAPPDLVFDSGIAYSNFSELGSVAMVAAPISVDGKAVGSIVAGVVVDPGRLAVTPRLADRLKGLAAQASIAISNARLIDKIRFQAGHDPLTGLPNRALILDRTERMLARARRSGLPVAALFIDLDGFKDVNDTLGHGAGDWLLKAVAERLSVTTRDADSIGRLGGDEFVVLVDGTTMDAGPELVAERLLDVLRAPFVLEGGFPGPLSVTASIGIAMGIRSTAAELLRDADIALYQAKAGGKDCFVAFQPEMHAAVQERLLLEMDLREPHSLLQYFLVYQPIFNLASGETTGVEALLRWDHPRRGVVGPDAFIPILEDSGMIVEVGRWVLDEACRQGVRWRDRGYRLDVSVNVSARQLETDRLVEDVRDALQTSGLEPSSLIVEITETAIMRDVSAVIPRLEALKATGVRIAIDDFGTGYSSLAYLQQFPVDTLKIDRSFISSMATSTGSGALIRTLVQLGKALGLETLAEGIEECEQYSQLEREQCDSGQGFLFARPLDAGAVEAFLDARSHREISAGAR